MSVTWISLHPNPLLPITTFKLHHNNTSTPSLPSLSTTSATISTTKRQKTQFSRLYAADEEATALLETTQQIVATSDDPTANVISILLLIAFAVLSLLTIGVIYLGVTDFLQKREKEKFEKEEAAKVKKKGRKKGKVVRARSAPRGFGQKINEEEDDDDDL